MTFKEHIEKLVFFETNPEWVWYDEEDMPHLTEKAPPKAVESYEYWKKEIEKNGGRGRY